MKAGNTSRGSSRPNLLILAKKTFFLGLLCCQCLQELNLAYNNIALIAEVKKLASLTNLSNLSVEGELKQEVLEAIVDESFFFVVFCFLFLIIFYSNVCYSYCYHYCRILVH